MRGKGLNDFRFVTFIGSERVNNVCKNLVALPYVEVEIMSSKHSVFCFVFVFSGKAENSPAAEAAQALKSPGLTGLIEKLLLSNFPILLRTQSYQNSPIVENLFI